MEATGLTALVHDLRAPLTVVLGFSDLLARRGATMEAERRAEALARLGEATLELRRRLDEARAAGG